jgi:hypothetical protein
MDWRHENELNAAALQMRNTGQNAVLTLSRGYIGLREWLTLEFDRMGFDKSKMVCL